MLRRVINWRIYYYYYYVTVHLMTFGGRQSNVRRIEVESEL